MDSGTTGTEEKIKESLVKKNTRVIDMDAWSDGQMRSKLWLCQELEKLFAGNDPISLGVYGAWYGTLPFLLLARERLLIREIHLFDLDRDAISVAKQVLRAWDYNPSRPIHFHVQDCSQPGILTDLTVDLVINTSCEHFENYDWFKNLPKGQRFALQSTDMPHPTHINSPRDMDDFKARLGSMTRLDLEDVLTVSYPNFSFRRFMVIGCT